MSLSIPSPRWSRRRPAARRPAVLLAAVLGVLAVAACAGPGSPVEGIGFREARFEEMSAIREFRGCRDEGLQLDREAHANRSAAGYLASARVLERCEAELGPQAAGVAMEERMRAYALSVQNYVKGGDVARARDGLGRFRTAFGGYDLYYPDGASFLDTMDMLTGLKNPPPEFQPTLLNVGNGTRRELQRADYWKRN